MIDVVSVHRFLSRLGGRTQATLCVCMITITKRPLNYPFSRIPVHHFSRLPYIIINFLPIYWILHVEPAIGKRLLKLSEHDRVLKFAPMPKSILSPCRSHSTNMTMRVRHARKLRVMASIQVPTTGIPVESTGVFTERAPRRRNN